MKIIEEELAEIKENTATTGGQKLFTRLKNFA